MGSIGNPARNEDKEFTASFKPVLYGLYVLVISVNAILAVKYFFIFNFFAMFTSLKCLVTLVVFSQF